MLGLDFFVYIEFFGVVRGWVFIQLGFLEVVGALVWDLCGFRLILLVKSLQEFSTGSSINLCSKRLSSIIDSPTVTLTGLQIQRAGEKQTAAFKNTGEANTCGKRKKIEGDHQKQNQKHIKNLSFCGG